MNSNEPQSRRDFLRRVGAGTAGALLLPQIDALAAESPVDADGYRSLFDGKTLAGWHTNPKRIGHGTGGLWKVVDGVITGTQDPPGNGGLLLTDEQFGDFDVIFDLNPDWGPDSGVFFRCTDGGEGFQYYVDYHEGGNVGHLRGEMDVSFALMPFKVHGNLDANGKLESLTMAPDPRRAKWPEGVYEYLCEPEDFRKVWKVNDWNTGRIRCVGKNPKVTTWVNGLKLGVWNGETCPLPGYDKDHVFSRLGRKGSIGLQVHGGNKAWPAGGLCRFRNIRIKEL